MSDLLEPDDTTNSKSSK